ncbi:MAG: hypothetical protein U9Q33_13525, partial [Campylobacterota bacterium]|nr:hypothetical protein [Campylobacterota bacterium]
KYKKDRTLNTGSFGKTIDTENDKAKMIKHWSYLLNSNRVEIMNKNIFEILEDKSISNNSLVYLDPPYLDSDYDYGFDNSDSFQIKLLESSKRFDYRLYSNEECETLYNLEIPKYFDNYNLYERKRGINGKEFLGFNIKENSTLIQYTDSNNCDYKPQSIKNEKLAS